MESEEDNGTSSSCEGSSSAGGGTEQGGHEQEAGEVRSIFRMYGVLHILIFGFGFGFGFGTEDFTRPRDRCFLCVCIPSSSCRGTSCCDLGTPFDMSSRTEPPFRPVRKDMSAVRSMSVSPSLHRRRGWSWAWHETAVKPDPRLVRCHAWHECEVCTTTRPYSSYILFNRSLQEVSKDASS